jgi:hypothetical protein
VKALSLWQPWASLIAVGGKRIETRHWPAPSWLVGQRIAIHAAKRESELWMCMRAPFALYLPDPDLLPRGYVIATARLDRCPEMTPAAIEMLERNQPEEHAFGLYEPGRFAWVLQDVRRLVEPVAFRGRQGLFDVPDEIAGLATVPAAVEQTAS